MLPLAKVALEAHALGNLKAGDDAPLDLLPTVICRCRGGRLLVVRQIVDSLFQAMRWLQRGPQSNLYQWVRLDRF